MQKLGKKILFSFLYNFFGQFSIMPNTSFLRDRKVL